MRWKQTMTAQTWIKKLRLQPHPEGGYYRETYRAGESLPTGALPRRFKGGRSISTAIYFLLKRGQVSCFHRIRSDEMWHHYAGGALIIHGLTDKGRHFQIKLGTRLTRGERPQAVIPAGIWFGAVLAPGASFALAGCTVAPGFDFTDFELADRESLLRKFPSHKAIIRALTA